MVCFPIKNTGSRTLLDRTLNFEMKVNKSSVHIEQYPIEVLSTYFTTSKKEFLLVTSVSERIR